LLLPGATHGAPQDKRLARVRYDFTGPTIDLPDN